MTVETKHALAGGARADFREWQQRWKALETPDAKKSEAFKERRIELHREFLDRFVTVLRR
jgi:hypothetical protein